VVEVTVGDKEIFDQKNLRMIRPRLREPDLGMVGQCFRLDLEPMSRTLSENSLK
jgi:hypothetical protein